MKPVIEFQPKSILVGLSWADVKDVLGHEHTGMPDDDERLVLLLRTEELLPRWLSDAGGFVDEWGWWLERPMPATTLPELLESAKDLLQQAEAQEGGQLETDVAAEYLLQSWYPDYIVYDLVAAKDVDHLRQRLGENPLVWPHARRRLRLELERFGLWVDGSVEPFLQAAEAYLKGVPIPEELAVRWRKKAGVKLGDRIDQLLVLYS